MRDVPAVEESGRDPLLVLHGFPSCSYDYRGVLPALSAERRVVLLDFLGCGLSDKPDRRYGVRMQADVVEAVVASTGLERVAMLTHDMGDSVGGEVLARDLEGTLRFEVTNRVVTNGSIYMDLVQLTAGLLAAGPEQACGSGMELPHRDLRQPGLDRPPDQGMDELDGVPVADDAGRLESSSLDDRLGDSEPRQLGDHSEGAAVAEDSGRLGQLRGLATQLAQPSGHRCGGVNTARSIQAARLPSASSRPAPKPGTGTSVISAQ